MIIRQQIQILQITNSICLVLEHIQKQTKEVEAKKEEMSLTETNKSVMKLKKIYMSF